jgi:hypothetical protein
MSALSPSFAHLIVISGVSATEITLTASPTSTTYGQTVIFSGKLNVSMNVDIFLIITSSSSTINQTVSAQNGSFTYTWLPPAATSYSATASWKGDTAHLPSASSPVTIFVDKLKTTITMNPASLNTTQLSPITFNGEITPSFPGAPVTITIQAPNGTTQTIMLAAAENSTFNFRFQPSGIGTWELTASWIGDDNHYASVSTMSMVRVTPILRPSSNTLPILILGFVAIPASIAVAIFVYKHADTPPRLPGGQIRKRRAPSHLRPLRVLNGAICPICFRPMMYEPIGADWHCEHCGVYYET